MKLRAGFLIVGLLSLVACGAGEHFAPASVGSEGGQNFNSFESISTGILKPQCTSCHSGNHPAGNIDLSTYASVMAVRGVVTPGSPAQSKLYTEVQTGDMPDGAAALPANEVKAISDWITAGAPNGAFAAIPTPAPTPNPTPTPPTPPAATFAQVQSEILNVSCTGCHSGARPSGKTDLTTYAKVMGKAGLVVAGDAAKSLLFTEINSGNMPPRGSRVSAANIALLQRWIDSGAPNN